MNTEAHNPFPLLVEGEIGGEAVQTVVCRDLHAALKVGRDFTTWIKDRIAKYGFIEGADYATALFPNLGERGQGRDFKEYFASVEMAKELAMVENNDEGRRCRRHFIECERRLKEAEKSMSPAEALIAHGKAMLAVERRQAALAVTQEEQGAQIAETQRRLNQIETATDYFTVVGYARWAKKTSIDIKTAAEVGRHATRRANHLGVKIGKIPDPRFGAVSQYPKAVLDFVWDECFPPVGGVQ